MPNTCKIRQGTGTCMAPKRSVPLWRAYICHAQFIYIPTDVPSCNNIQPSPLTIIYNTNEACNLGNETCRRPRCAFVLPISKQDERITRPCWNQDRDVQRDLWEHIL